MKRQTPVRRRPEPTPRWEVIPREDLMAVIAIERSRVERLGDTESVMRSVVQTYALRTIISNGQTHAPRRKERAKIAPTEAAVTALAGTAALTATFFGLKVTLDTSYETMLENYVGTAVFIGCFVGVLSAVAALGTIPDRKLLRQLGILGVEERRLEKLARLDHASAIAALSDEELLPYLLVGGQAAYDPVVVRRFGRYEPANQIQRTGAASAIVSQFLEDEPSAVPDPDERITIIGSLNGRQAMAQQILERPIGAGFSEASQVGQAVAEVPGLVRDLLGSRPVWRPAF